METNKWEVLQIRFIKAHENTGVSVKHWCEKNALNYDTARRHIKIEDKNTMLAIYKSDQKSETTKRRVASLGNQNARTLGHYSEFITTDEDALRHNSALKASLSEELALIRMQLANLMVGIKKVEAKLNGELTIDQTLTLYEKYAKLQTNFDVKIGRIESLENSIINHKKITADIEKTIALTQKAQLEADKLRNQSSGGNETLTEIYNDILAMGSDGMMNTN
ncbi:MAG: hypothetical protein ACJAS1_002642 [Oleiphilaceae bacterium]|jgi:hypothetical protein